MKALVLLSLISLSLFAQAPGPPPGPLTNDRVTELVKSGVRADEIARIIATAPAVDFHLAPADTNLLLQSGVSEDTIKAMAARESGTTLATTTPPPASPFPPTQGLATPSRAPRDSAGTDFIHRGSKDVSLFGTVVIPHYATGSTTGIATFRVGYYIGRSSMIGGDLTVLADSGGQLYVPGGFYRFVAHTGNPRFFPFVGAEAGAIIAHAGGAGVFRGSTDSRFAAKGEAGIKYFVARNVAFEGAYNLLWAHISGLGFSDSSVSAIVFGFSYTF